MCPSIILLDSELWFDFKTESPDILWASGPEWNVGVCFVEGPVRAGFVPQTVINLKSSVRLSVMSGSFLPVRRKVIFSMQPKIRLNFPSRSKGYLCSIKKIGKSEDPWGRLYCSGTFFVLIWSKRIRTSLLATKDLTNFLSHVDHLCS